jgi:hypothetical protein
MYIESCEVVCSFSSDCFAGKYFGGAIEFQPCLLPIKSTQQGPFSLIILNLAIHVRVCFCPNTTFHHETSVAITDILLRILAV